MAEGERVIALSEELNRAIEEQTKDGKLAPLTPEKSKPTPPNIP